MLDGEVEVDEAFFTTTRPKQLKDRLLSRGNGSERKTAVVVMSQSYTPDHESSFSHVNQKRYKHKRGFGQVRFATVPDLKKRTVMGKVRVNNKKGSTISSDASKSQDDFRLLYNHKGEDVPSKKAHKILPWVHISIGNAKRDIEAVHHMVMPQFLQYYLDLWSYKTNRRRQSNRHL